LRKSAENAEFSVQSSLALWLNGLLESGEQDSPIAAAARETRAAATWGCQMAHIELPEAARAVAAHGATVEILFHLGMMYCNGRGADQDLIAAHKWFNLAALKGSEDARHYRSELSREMSPSQIHEAQRQARAWLTLH
jgi:uncharacterized protein